MSQVNDITKYVRVLPSRHEKGGRRTCHTPFTDAVPTYYLHTYLHIAPRLNMQVSHTHKNNTSSSLLPVANRIRRKEGEGRERGGDGADAICPKTDSLRPIGLGRLEYNNPGTRLDHIKARKRESTEKKSKEEKT